MLALLRIFLLSRLLPYVAGGGTFTGLGGEETQVSVGGALSLRARRGALPKQNFPIE